MSWRHRSRDQGVCADDGGSNFRVQGELCEMAREVRWDSALLPCGARAARGRAQDQILGGEWRDQAGQGHAYHDRDERRIGADGAGAHETVRK